MKDCYVPFYSDKGPAPLVFPVIAALVIALEFVLKKLFPGGTNRNQLGFIGADPPVHLSGCIVRESDYAQKNRVRMATLIKAIRIRLWWYNK
ncbi:MAG: hypothetical protein AMR96_03225 [Candidatus Adiutrix intracellularis]|nr:MAG: hypothetical protein AMR96_03225 [Candidatus Adiutrix intracellularis]